MAKSSNRWIRTVWGRELNKEENAIVVKVMSTMNEVGVTMRFERDLVRLDDEVIDVDYKTTWRKVKHKLQKAIVQ